MTLKEGVCERTFYDSLSICKGPSLGTNFTLACPYTLLAHYHELEFAQAYDVDPNLVRVAVGLEKFEDITAAFDEALLMAAGAGATEAGAKAASAGAGAGRRGFSTLAPGGGWPPRGGGGAGGLGAALALRGRAPRPPKGTRARATLARAGRPRPPVRAPKAAALRLRAVAGGGARGRGLGSWRRRRPGSRHSGLEEGRKRKTQSSSINSVESRLQTTHDDFRSGARFAQFHIPLISEETAG